MDPPNRPPSPPRQASVRVRRGTTSGTSRPPLRFDPASLPRGTLRPDDALAPPPSELLELPVPTRRRRAATLTQRLFADDLYAPLGDGEPQPTRARAASSVSRTSARAATPVVVSIKGRTSEEGDRPVSPKLIGRRRGSSAARSQTALQQQLAIDEEHHAEQEVDVLEVLDQSVSTTATLGNIQGAFLPNFLNRKPVCELEPPSPPTELDGITPLVTSPSEQQLLEDADPLDLHLAKLLKKQKRKDQTKLVLKGIWAFLKTPIGVCAGIYGFLVVFWGAGLVLVLIGAIPMNSYDKKLWVEIASQILTGLFCITSLLPLPWRLIDWYNIIIIWRSARLTRQRRAKLALPPLRDPNDLPDPPQAEFWVAPGGEKLSGPRPSPSTAPSTVKKHTKKGDSPSREDGSVTPEDRAVELMAMESKAGTVEDEEVVVLSEEEEERLRRAQVKFARSQTWYRPHTTPTHHASPIKWAMWVAILMVGNSFFQVLLCADMWSWNRFNRPPWTTGCLIPLSFGCGIGAAILIWKSGEKTKRKAEVTKAMWAMLKKDEDELEERRKHAAEERAAAKAAKRHSHHVSASG